MEENKTEIPSQNNTNKKYIYIAVVAAVAALVMYLVVKTGPASEDELVDNDAVLEEAVLSTSSAISSVVTTTSTVSASTSVTPLQKAAPSAPVKKPSVPLSATQKYLDALKIYKNTGYYFQFVQCHGTPGSLTMKKGKKFMLDNRDAKTRKIAITGGQSFRISAYNFAIATAPSKPGTYFITCDGGGAAKIVVQQ